MKLLKSSVISVSIMYLLTVGAFWVFGISNELQKAMTVGAAIVGAIVLPIVYVAWGLPAHLLMQKFGIRHVAIYSIVGAVPGATFVNLFKPFGLDPFGQLVLQSIFCSFIGAVGAVIIWYFQVQRSA